MLLDENIRSLLDRIFAGVLVGSLTRDDEEILQKKKAVLKTTKGLFISRFKHCIFNDEYAIFWNVAKELGVNICSRADLKLILENNQGIILDSKYIDWTPFSYVNDRPTTDEERYDLFTEIVLRKFDELSYKYVDENEYQNAVTTYIELYIKDLEQNTVQNMALILSDGSYTDKAQGRRKTYKGIEGLQQYFQSQQEIVRSLLDNTGGEDYVVDSSWLEQKIASLKSSNDSTELFTTGIKPIDDSIQFIRRGRMYNILGAPKGGKTTLANHLVARALESGLNVAVWAVEGSSRDWENKQIAHIIFNDNGGSEAIEANIPDTEQAAIVVSSDRVDKPNEWTDDEQAVVCAAMAKLATHSKTGQDRGVLSFIGGTAYVEDFRAKLLSHYEQHPYDVLVIDSPLNFLSLTGKSSVERIKEGFINLATFASSGLSQKVACIVTSQLKQTAIDEMIKRKDKSFDITAGGESSEVIRTPDEVWCLYSTESERKNGKIRIQNLASRQTGGFATFYGRVNLGSAYFTYVPDYEEQ